ncbi:MAG: hypothetical protein ACOYZ8_11645 [Chloroflexota bacterium]
MKIICKTLIPLFLAVVLSSCNDGVAAIPTMSQVNIMGTAMSIAKTEVVMTMTAVPTATYPPPTPIPPQPTTIPPDSYADKIDYAMTIAPTIYNKLPYIKDAIPMGEYSGCTQTYDFHNFVHYQVLQPMDVVNNAFLNYFMTEKWEFTEPYSELVTWNNNISTPRITYDVFRISSKDKPSFERLKIILTDETLIRGENFVEVRAELTYVETKNNLEYLLEPLACYNRQEAWLWIRLQK